MGNPVDPRTSKTVRQLGQTVLGANWVIRALHPCGEGINIVPKIPDGALTDSVVLERRDEFDIKMPNVDPFIKGGTWNLLIVSIPVVKTPLAAIAYTDTATRASIQNAWTQVINRFGDATEKNAPNNENYDPTYTYPSWHVNAELYPQAAVTVCQMANLDSGKLANDMVSEFLTIRRTYMGTTMDFDANSLTNKGRLVSGQIAADFAEGQFDIRAKLGDPITSTQRAMFMGDIPLSETEITQQDSKVRQAECVEGDYAPNRFWEPVFLNSSSKDLHVYTAIDPNNEDGFVVTAKPNVNIPLKGWGYQISFWLSIQDTSSIRVKRREGLELNTSSRSDYSPFSTPAFPRDDRAQMIFREFCREQKHSFPACFNSVGGMLKDIVSTIGGVLSNLNIPIISDIARRALPVANSIFDAFTL